MNCSSYNEGVDEEPEEASRVRASSCAHISAMRRKFHTHNVSRAVVGRRPGRCDPVEYELPSWRRAATEEVPRSRASPSPLHGIHARTRSLPTRP